MKEKIFKFYEKLNHDFLNSSQFNNKETRDKTRKKLFSYLITFDPIDLKVKCDEENNSPDIVDQQCLVAKVSWKERINSIETSFADLVFGQPEQVSIIQQKLLSVYC